MSIGICAQSRHQQCSALASSINQLPAIGSLQSLWLMALAARARCTRGLRVSVNEETLKELYNFFQERQRKGELFDDAAWYRTGFGKVISIAWPRDWFVTEEIGPWWSIETGEQRQQFFEYVVRLHKLGIPSFFCERRPIDEMKFFMQFQANLDGGIQHGAKDMEKLAIVINSECDTKIKINPKAY